MPLADESYNFSDSDFLSGEHDPHEGDTLDPNIVRKTLTNLLNESKEIIDESVANATNVDESLEKINDALDIPTTSNTKNNLSNTEVYAAEERAGRMFGQ